MDETPEVELGREGPPTKFPEVPPSSYAESVRSAWFMESITQMQQTIGELKAALNHLAASSEKQAAKLESICHWIYTACAVIIILLVIDVFCLSKIWDGMFMLLKTAAH